MGGLVLLTGVCDREGERWVWTTERSRGMCIQRDRPRGREMGEERESNNQIKWVERESTRIKRVS